MKLHTYLNEVFDIAKANDMAWDIGVDMFLANVRNAGQTGLPYYPGAETVNYEALKEHQVELADSREAFTASVRGYLPEIASLRGRGEREAAVRLIAAPVCDE